MSLKRNKQKSNQIIAFPFDNNSDYTGDLSQWIRPCTPRRPWMDNTPERYAYRCIPMTMANSIGWEIINPVSFEAIWHGDQNTNSLVIKFDDGKDHNLPRSHFGSGIITWDLPVLFRTPPGVGMMVTGPVNHPKHGIMPLQGLVETEWLPNGFTMNWLITQAEQTIRFEAGEPFCRIFPYRMDYVESFNIDVMDPHNDPKLRNQNIAWVNSRQHLNKKAASIKDSESVNKGQWSGNYVKGKDAVGSKFAEHKNIIRCNPIRDKR